MCHGGTWQYLAAIGSTWQHLAVLGSTWQHLAALGSTWQYLSILSKHQDQTGGTVMGIAGTNFQKNAEPTSCSPLKWFNG